MTNKSTLKTRIFSLSVINTIKMLSCSLAVVLFTSISVKAQLSGSYTVPGSYSTVNAAINALNTNGVSASVTINIAAGYTEIAPIGGYILGSAVLNPSLTASTTLLIQKDPTTIGANPILNAYVGNSTTADGIFKIAGADYTTINMIDLFDGNSGTPACMEVGYALVNLSAITPFDGCQNDTIKNCTVTLNRLNPNISIGIFAGHNTATSATALTITATDDAHNNNKIYGNTVTNSSIGIYFNGFAAASPYTLYDQNNDIGGSSVATGNTLTNLGGNAAANCFGVALLNQNNANGSYNTINNALGGVGNTTQTMGLYFNGTNSSFTANNNNVTLNQASGASVTGGIYGAVTGTGSNTTTNNILNFVDGGGSTHYGVYNSAAGAVNISGNTFNETTTAAVSFVFYGIYNATLSASQTINNNNFLNYVVNNASTMYMMYLSNTTTNVTISGNTINNFNRTSAAGSTYCIYNASSPLSGTSTITNNTFSNFTLGGTNNCYGIYESSGAAHSKLISGNTLSNWSIAGAGQFYGIYCAAGLTNNIFNNTVSNLNSLYTSTTYCIYAYGGTTGVASVHDNLVQNCSINGSTIYGILNTQGAATTVNVYNNIIRSLTTNALTGIIQGMLVSAGTGTINVYNNKISDIVTNTTSSGIVSGLAISGGTTLNVYNNLIGNLRAPFGSNGLTDNIRGINITSVTALATLNLTYNTVYINATSTGINFSSSALFATTAATATSATLNLRDNIFINTSTANGTGFTSAYRRSSAQLLNYGAVSDYNLFYAGPPGVKNFIYYDGTNSQQTLADYKAMIVNLLPLAPRDANSKTEGNTPFLSLVATSPQFLHIDPTQTTVCESGGFNVAGYTADYDAEIRAGNGGYTGSGTAPDIGADEFNTPAACAGVPNVGSVLPASPVSVCPGFASTLSANPSSTSGVTYQWTSSAISGGPYSNIPGATSITISSGPLFVNTYYKLVVTCTSSGLMDSTTEVGVSVNVSPTVAIGSVPANATICGVGNVVMTASGATTYAWNPASGLNAATGVSVTATPSAPTIYSVTGTDGNGCTATATKSVAVSQVITLNATATPPSICANGTSVLYVTDTTPGPQVLPTGYGASNATATTDDEIWRVNITGTPLNNSSNCSTTGGGALNGLPASTVQWYSNYTYLPATNLYAGTTYNGFLDLSNCGTFAYSQGDAIFIDLNRNGVFDMPNERVYASASTQTGGLYTVPPGFVTYPFSFSIPSTASKGLTLMRVIGIESTAGTSINPTGTYSWGETEDYLVNIIASTGINAATGYTWSPTSFLSSTIGNNPTASLVTGTTTYTVTGTDANGCSGTTSITITADPLTCGTPTVSSPVCENTNYTVTSFRNGGGAPFTYLWDNGATTASRTQSNVAGSYTYTVTVSDFCGASCSSSVTVIVNSYPSLTLTPTSASMCLNSPTGLSASGGTSYSWSPASGLNVTTGSSVSANPTSTTTYTVTAGNGTGCTVSGSIPVTVNPIPSISASTSLAIICSGDSAQLTATGPPPTIAGYSFSQSITPYTPIVGTVVSSTGDDDVAYPIAPIGFTFNYHGVPFTQVGLSANCYMALGVAAAGGYTPLSTQANTISGMGGDMYGLVATHQCRYETSGSVGNRVFTAEWFNWGKYSSGLNEFNMQIKLYEATGVVRIIYQPTTPATAFTVQVGLNGAAITDFNNRTTATDWSATTAGAANTATCSFSGTIFPANGLTYTFTPPPTVTFAWSPATGLSATNISNPKASPPIGTTIYTVTVTSIGSGCTNTASVSLTNLGYGDVPPTVTNGSACAGQMDHLSASGLSTLRWYTAQIGGLLKHIGPNWDSVWTATTTYWVESFNGVCPSQRTSVVVTVLPLPIVTAGADIAICPGDSAQIGGSAISGGAIYYMRYAGGEPWSSASNTTELNAAYGAGNWTLSTYESASPAPAVLFSNTTKIVFMDGSDQSATALNSYLTANLTTIQNWVNSGGHLFLNAAPNLGGNINFGFGGVLCNYPATTATATISAGQTGHPIFNGPALPVGTSWTGSSFGHATITGGGTTALIDGTGNPVVTELSYGAGKVIFGGMTMTSFHTPQPQADNLRTNILAYLNTGFSIGGYVWTPATGLSSTNIANPKAAPSVNTNYTVTMTNALNGCTASDQVFVTVNSAPPNPTINGNTTFCGCGQSTLTATANGVGTTLRWYDAATGGTLLGTGSPFTTAYFCGTKTFYVEEYDAVSGCKSLVRASVTVIPTTATAVSAGSDVVLCDGNGPATLVASSLNDPNYSYTWSPATGLNQTTGSTVTSGPGSTTTYIVTGIDIGTGCINTDTVRVGVGVTPVINSVTVSSNNFCAGNSTTLSANIAGAGSGIAYTLSSIPFAPVSPVGSPIAGPSGDDVISSLIPIGFNFNFYGTVYSNLVIGTNGFISFDAAPGSGCCSGQLLPSATAPNNLIATCWTDLNTAYGGTIDYFNLTSPNRFVIRYNGVGHHVGTVQVTSQIILYQSGAIEIHNTSINSQGTMTQGIENATGTLAVVVPGRNATGWTANNDAYRFAVPPTVNYTWAPAASLNNSTASNPVATPPSTTVYTVTVSDFGGCSSSSTVLVTVTPLPPTPLASGSTICGQGVASVTAAGSGGTLLWTEDVGGPVVATGNSYNPYVYSSRSYYVRENPGGTTQSVGLTAYAVGTVAFASSTVNYQTFNVLSANGIIINTVDVVPNAAIPLGTPISIQLENNAGVAIGSPVSTVTTTQGTQQTITLNMFVPQGNDYRLRPVQNPNLQYHQTGFVNPYTIPGQVSITGWGPPNATTLYVFFYNWSVTTGCMSLPAIANVIVNPAPALTITPTGSTSYCNTGSVILNATGDPSYNSFSWSPAAGLSATSGSTVTASPSVTTSYLLTATNPSGCIDTETVVVTVNTGPFINLVSNAPYDTLCLGAPFQYQAAAGSNSYKRVGLTESTAATNGYIYSGGNTSVQNQLLFTASELNTAGIFGPTFINSLGFKVSQKLSVSPYLNFTIKMKMTTEVPPIAATEDNTGLTTVYTNVPGWTTSVGWNDHVFQVPFAWDGTSNVLVDVCFTNPGLVNFDQVYVTNTALFQYRQPSLLNCGQATGVTNLARPNVRFTGGAVTYSWSPGTDLSNTTIGNPVYTSASVGNKAYIVTTTDPSNGCTATATSAFVVSTTPKIPQIVAISDSVFCYNGIPVLQVTGTTGSFQWQTSTDGINFSDVLGATNSLLTYPSITITRYFRVFVHCTGDSSYSRIIPIIVNSPQVATSQGVTICGIGQVCLQATPNDINFVINWYSAATGGTSLGVGNTFCTNISSTTTFYAEASVNGYVCSSARVAVIAVSTTPPALVPSAASTICEASSGIISVSSSDLNYSYTWNPGNLSGATQTVSPTSTTTYTVLAQNSQTGCANVATTIVTVTPRPSISTVIANPSVICGVDSSQLSVTATPFIPPSGGSYIVEPITFAPVSPSGSPIPGPSGDDVISGSIPIGFGFNFYGTVYSNLVIGTNGFISFDAAPGSGCCSGQLIPNTLAPNNLIAACWTDLNTAYGGTIDYFNLTSPNRFVVRYNGVGHHVGTVQVTSQIILYQSGVIEIHNTSINSQGVMTEGIENVGGTVAVPVAGRNATGWAATNDAYRFSIPIASSLTYSWTPSLGLNSSTISNPKASPGVNTVYTVTVLETGTGCTRTSTVFVGIAPSPAPKIVEPDTSVCGNSPGFYLHVIDTGSYAGGYPPGTYFEWVNYTPATLGLDSILVNSTDGYKVVVTLPSGLVYGGCSDTSNVEHADFTGAQAPVPLMDQDTVRCKGESNGSARVHLIVGGNASVNYKWYNASNTLLRNVTSSNIDDTLKNLPAGHYTVVVTNNVGTTFLNCGEVGEVDVFEPDVLSVSENTNNHVNNGCFESANGLIDINVTGGTTLYNYSWSNGATTEDLNNGLTGTYTVLITDYHGCSTSISSTISSPPVLTVACSSNNVSCNSNNDGTGTVVAEGGTQPYHYAWDNGSTTSSINSLSPGVYCVVVTDAHGCTASCCITITQPNLLLINPTITMVSCKNAHDGTISLAPSGGTGPYHYLWNNFNTSPLRTGLFPGTYSVSVTDANGCIAYGTYTILQSPTQLAANVVKSNVKCGGKCTGIATANPTGGTAPFTYLWNTGSTAASITGLCAGSYTLTVTDAYNCVRVQPFIITQNPVMILTVVPSGLTQATASVSGGVPPYAYYWSTVPPQTNATATALTPGLSFKVKATDAKGCSKVGTVLIPLPKQSVSQSINDGLIVSAYPNPTTGLLTLTFNSNETFKFTLKLYDVTGREVYLREATNETGSMSANYDFSTFPKGVYQLSVLSEKGSAVLKVILQ